MRAGPQFGVDAYGVRRCGSVMPVCKQPVATLTLQTFAKAARAPPCTLPILAQAPTLRLNHGHTSMAVAFALTGCGRRFYFSYAKKYFFKQKKHPALKNKWRIKHPIQLHHLIYG